MVGPKRWDYQHISAYLAYVRPRLAAIRDSADILGNIPDDRAAEWLRDFRKALHTRINLKGGGLAYRGERPTLCTDVRRKTGRATCTRIWLPH